MTVQVRVVDADNGLFIYTDANFKGDCTNIKFNYCKYTIFPAGVQSDISAISPLQGSVCDVYMYVCQLWLISIFIWCTADLVHDDSDFLCNSDSLENIAFSGICDFKNGDTKYNDCLNSSMCFSE